MNLSQMTSRWNELIGKSEIPDNACYVYSRDIATENFRSLVREFGERVRVLVSIKANPNVLVNQSLMELGASFDVASVGELKMVMQLASSDDSVPFVSMVGPGKPERLISDCRKLGVTQLVLESVRELELFAKIYADATLHPLVQLRVNPSETPIEANEVMGGRSSQFGVDEECIPSAWRRAMELGIAVDGLHTFLGSQIHSTAEIQKNVEITAKVAESVATKCDASFDTVCFGGGFGIPHTSTDELVDLRKVSSAVASALDRLSDLFARRVTGQIEAGRYIYGNAGVYVCRIVELKESKGRLFAIVDVGISGFSRPIVVWGEEHPIWKLGEGVLDSGGTACTLVGPTCLPGDMLASNVFLENPQPGDVLIVGNAGAYGYSMSLLSWGSLDHVPEMII